MFRIKPRWVMQRYETDWYDDWVCCGKPVATSLTKLGIAIRWWLSREEAWEGLHIEHGLNVEYCQTQVCRGY